MEVDKTWAGLISTTVSVWLDCSCLDQALMLTELQPVISGLCHWSLTEGLQSHPNKRSTVQRRRRCRNVGVSTDTNSRKNIFFYLHSVVQSLKRTKSFLCTDDKYDLWVAETRWPTAVLAVTQILISLFNFIIIKMFKLNFVCIQLGTNFHLGRTQTGRSNISLLLPSQIPLLASLDSWVTR